MSWSIVNADNRHVLAAMPENSVDAICTDPPYELAFMGKRWDATGIAFDVALWRAVLRVLKPGGHLLAFSGTRTYHRMVCAIEDAGFEIRDQLAWMTGTGFPKSKNIAMSIDKGEGVIGHRSVRAVTAGSPDPDRPLPGPDRSVGAYVPEPGSPGAPWSGWGTALKPAHEPIVLARKPLIGTVAANVLAHGTGGINVDACRIGWANEADKAAGRPASLSKDRASFSESDGRGTFKVRDRSGECPIEAQSSGGRWPANVLLDEEAAAMLDQMSGPNQYAQGRNRREFKHAPAAADAVTYNAIPNNGSGRLYSDTGGASRFFYVAKASKAEREAGLGHLPVRTGGELTDRVDGSDGLNSPHASAGRGGGRRNHHPTVKPIALMRYLVRLITPPGGIVLDPFCGSGSTIAAAVLEGFHAIGLELQPEYVEIARARVAHCETKR